MQEAVGTCEGPRRATRGTLVLAKTFWYASNLKWEDEDWEYTAIKDIPAELEMKNMNGQVYEIKRLEPETVQ